MAEESKPDGNRIALLTEALNDAVSIFQKLDPEGRVTLIKTLSTWYNISDLSEIPLSGPRTVAYGQPTERFTREQGLSPKEFFLKKQPRSDVERVACLGYYLAYYKNQPHFKTLDISKLNTEAAQSKFSNAAYAVDNATKLGYLAPATKGMKQMSAGGEKFVEALPDRDAAADVLLQNRRKRRLGKKVPRKNG